MLEFEKVNSGVRTLKTQINLLWPEPLCPVLQRCFSGHKMLPCRVSAAQGLDLALPCADGLQSISFLPLSISLPSPALQICLPPWIHTVDFLWVCLWPIIQADNGDFRQNWHQYPPLGADTSDQPSVCATDHNLWSLQTVSIHFLIHLSSPNPTKCGKPCPRPC